MSVKKAGTVQPPGTAVEKYSGRTFKSGLKINTVLDVIDHPVLGRPAFTFFEDDSYVDVIMCRPATNHDATIYQTTGA